MRFTSMRAEPTNEVTIGRWGRWSIRIQPDAVYQRGEPIHGAALVYDPEESHVWYSLAAVTEPWFGDYLASKLRGRPGSQDGLADALRAARALVEAVRASAQQ